MSTDEEPHVVQDQPYDESMDVVDGEDVVSVYTPQPSSRRPPESLGSPRTGLKRSNLLTVPAPDSNGLASVPKFSREPPIHHQRDESPGVSPRDDDTQGDSDYDPPSSQILNGGAGGQKEYRAPDPNAYDPSLYRDLPVSSEIKDLFKCIEKFQPQDIVLDTKLKPFISEYIPAIGDIDAFLKVPRPDGKEDSLALAVLDEPSSRQSDPHVLNLQLRYTSKQPISTSLTNTIRRVSNADKNPKAIEEWVHNISKLQKAKTVDTIQYRKPMPDIDSLMQEWPVQFEELLKETSVPPADVDTDLATYVDIACSLLDIPVYESRIPSLNALFTLYLGFKNSEHFKAIMNVSEQPMRRGANNNGADQMIID
ncbi:unnamed protein product [Rotaria magnacalcarata]|uniref:Intraflagellar transport protein 46 homolog n=1 Tax=Rotaria magnacalcarata TaxID=392030 RepID=A0A819HXG3_9BILA|nr:unnamed protein product [Rotaria magnacalcarata]CAF3880946.1 unnamed protein product [Rotaria magnacalcarata]CAF3904926.1 unnamed protein product [Rotaria magnacalcarata]CAF4467307.1 unnamed protein product [Rotaria magnacalcarata]